VIGSVMENSDRAPAAAYHIHPAADAFPQSHPNKPRQHLVAEIRACCRRFTHDSAAPRKPARASMARASAIAQPCGLRRQRMAAGRPHCPW
jgi:hypothetical protein